MSTGGQQGNADISSLDFPQGSSKPRVALSLSGDSLLGSKEGPTAAASAPQLLWDVPRHKSWTIGDFLAEFAKWSRIIIWGEAVIKGVLVFSANESRGKSITLGWKVNLNAKFPFIFWNKTGINLEIKCHFECTLKNEPNLPLPKCNWASVSRSPCPAFSLFLLWPFFPSETWIHGMFQGFCKLPMDQEHESTWKHHPKPRPCWFPSQSRAWVSTCPRHRCPLSPPMAQIPYGALIPHTGKALLQPQPCWLAAKVSNTPFQSTEMCRAETGGELSRSDALGN